MRWAGAERALSWRFNEYRTAGGFYERRNLKIGECKLERVKGIEPSS